MDHNNTGGVVSGSCVNCSHYCCDFDLIIHLPHNFEERYIAIAYYFCIIIIAHYTLE